MSRHFARACLLVLTFVFSLVARAQDIPTPMGPTPLTLEQCIALALKKNFDLQIQNYSTDVAREAVNIAKAGYDPVIFASANRTLSQASSATTTLDGTTKLTGPRADGTTGSVGVSELLPQTNGTVALSAGVSRSATNSDFSILNPAYGSGVTASVSQPLLKTAGTSIAKSTVERSKIGLSIAQLNYEGSVLTVVLNTETAYNNLVSARETLHIQQLSLALAQRLLDENQARRTTGVMTDLDVLTADVGVNNARLAVIQAEQGVLTAEDALITLINGESYDQRPGAVAFSEFTGQAPAFAPAYKLARENNPIYLAAVGAIQQSQIDLSVAKNATLPTLNLTGSLGYTTADSAYHSAIADLPNDHGNNWSLGLVYNMPWGMKADNARYRSTLATLGSLKARLAQIDQGLVVQVRAAVISVQTNLSSVDIAAKASMLSEKQYEAQKARFDAGLSTSRLVLQAQDDLATARFNELAAKVALHNALAQLHNLDTTSLQQYGIPMNR